MKYNLHVHFRSALSQLVSYLNFDYLVEEKMMSFVKKYIYQDIPELRINENPYKSY